MDLKNTKNAQKANLVYLSLFCLNFAVATMLYFVYFCTGVNKDKDKNRNLVAANLFHNRTNDTSLAEITLQN